MDEKQMKDNKAENWREFALKSFLIFKSSNEVHPHYAYEFDYTELCTEKFKRTLLNALWKTKIR